MALEQPLLQFVASAREPVGQGDLVRGLHAKAWAVKAALRHLRETGRLDAVGDGPKTRYRIAASSAQ